MSIIRLHLEENMRKNPHRSFGLTSMLVILVITFFGKDPFTAWMNSIGVSNPWWVFVFWILMIVVLFGVVEGVYLFFTRGGKSKD